MHNFFLLVCGQKPLNDRIIGGHDTYASEFPWMAAMVVVNSRQPFCIGSVSIHVHT